ncbi:hypothetical protein PHMEG_0003589 [Phytophthora megakarya]|uniref:Uncharacterized protein n=1 Tax=Phytophthora megakarya TaxID=4795 RepID=A0A225WYC3_9STRA|nr:hypothetical protein PHMEG_0003589 [Phytophthora megakarya]
MANVTSEEHADFKKKQRNSPAKVPPYKLRLKHDAAPFRCKARQFRPLQSAFMNEFNRNLVNLGLIYETRVVTAFAALPLKKLKVNQFRQAVDYKPLTAMSEAIAGVMPNLKSKRKRLKGKKNTFIYISSAGFGSNL